MRRLLATIAAVSAILVAGVGTIAHQGSLASQDRGGSAAASRTPILERAPSDHAVVIPADKLREHFKEMDGKGQQTLRLLEGGKYNVNIRRITKAETALVHPDTIDLWVALDGSGTLTSGGTLVEGHIASGRSHPLKPGDVEFIPSNLPHGVSGVDRTITWLNVRWDTDWPANAQLGAGTMPVAGRGAAPAEARAGALAPLEYAPTDHSVAIPKEKIDGYIRDMDQKNLAVLRMIEGGHFNVNIRRIRQPSTEVHPVTIDTWVVLEGAGTLSTGFKRDGDRVVPGTGKSQRVGVGDVVFIPAGLSHGFSEVDGVVSWLNIRWDVNWSAR